MKFWTVPHSGLRYVMKAANEADWDVLYTHTNIDDLKYHVPDPEREHFIQIRCPLATFGTWWAKGAYGGNQIPDGQKLAQVFTVYPKHVQGLIAFAERYPEIPVIRIEDGIEQYGLEPHDKKASRRSAMRDAIRRKSLQNIVEVDSDWGFFPWWCENIVPEIRDFYESHGYNFWWMQE